VQRNVLMEAMVDGVDEQVGRRRHGGGRPLALPVKGRCVVGTGLQGLYPYVKAVDACIVVKNASSKFKIGVCHGSCWIGEQDQVQNDVAR
jgi:hypothetical protein